MVLESLITPKGAERHPLTLFLFGLLYSSIAIFMGLWIFRDQASLVVVFLTVFACIPLMVKTMRYEEKKDLILKKEVSMLMHHKKVLNYFLFLFLGIVFGYSLWFLLLPPTTVQTLFSTQLVTINAINNRVTGDATSTVLFFGILMNNLKVMLFCLFFAFFYGAGAIFILTWNASVIAAAIGSFVRNNIGEYASQIGWIKVAGYMHIFSLGLLRYLTHGLFEILAYFIAGIAGSLISVAVIRHNVFDENFNKVLKDAGWLMVIALIVLLLAGLVEVYVTPGLSTSF